MTFSLSKPLTTPLPITHDNAHPKRALRRSLSVQPTLSPFGSLLQRRASLPTLLPSQNSFQKKNRRFTKLWNATQKKEILPELKLSRISKKSRTLIISEAKDDWLSRKYEENGHTVHRTFYTEDPEELSARTQEKNTAFWNWIADPFPVSLCSENSYDLIVARSMICACEEGDYSKGVSDGDSHLERTCGGVTSHTRYDILQMVSRLLSSENPKAKAYLTLSPRLDYQGLEHRGTQRNKALAFWNPAIERFNSEQYAYVVTPVFVTQDNIPTKKTPAQTKSSQRFERKNDFFGLKLKKLT